MSIRTTRTEPLAVTLKTFKSKPDYSGQEIACPKCGRVLIEAEFLSLLKRCPKCGRWVLATKEKS